jgi:hypothetical protein
MGELNKKQECNKPLAYMPKPKALHDQMHAKESKKTQIYGKTSHDKKNIQVKRIPFCV